MPWPSLAEWWKVRQADKLFPEGERIGHVPVLDLLAKAALDIAVQSIGRGEVGGNNAGPDVAEFIAPAAPPQFWCAGFAGWCYEQAARSRGILLPFKRSLGAKRLGENVAAVGRKFMDPREAKPGDLLVLHRGDHGSTMGHVAIVESVDFPDTGRPWIDVIEGNAGPFPAKVRRHTYELAKARLAFFASIRR